MIIKSVEIEKFRAFEDASFDLGKRITAISGRNATQKTTVLGMIGQPFTISSKEHPMYGCKTIDGYNFRSQFKDKLKDKNYLENYMAASAGYKEYKGNNISAFYFKKMKSLYMYALQDKKDVSKAPHPSMKIGIFSNATFLSFVNVCIG